MKLSKSLTLWMMAFLFATVTAATPAHAAAITPEGRQELVAVYLTMFGRAPTSAQLAQMVAAREGGSTLVQVATTLSADAGFALVASKDADSFATHLADALLASDAPAEARAWAINWTVTQVQGTMTKAQVIAEAVQSMRATANPMFTSSKAELSADVAAALTAIDNPAPKPSAVQQTATSGPPSPNLDDILKDLSELTEDLKIEEEDNSGDYRSAKARIDAQPGLNDKTSSPSELYAEVEKLKTALKTATTDEDRKKVADEIVKIQAKTAVWTGTLGNDWAPTGDKEGHTLQLKESLKAINDRITTSIQNTIRSKAVTCTTAYDPALFMVVTTCK